MPRSRDEWIKHEVKEIIFYIVFGIVMTIIIPLFIGLALGGFEESLIEGRPIQFGDILFNYMIYYIMIFAGLIGLPALKVSEMIITNRGEHPANQSQPPLFGVSYIHDPEQDGFLYHVFEDLKKQFGWKKNYMSWRLSIPRMLILGTLIFATVGLVQSITHFNFVGIPQMPFQVTPATEVFFTAEPPAFAETTMLLFVFSLFMGFNGYFTSKYKWGKWAYFTLGILVCLIVGILWTGYHNAIYGHSDEKLFATFLFGFGGSAMTLLLGTFIWWYLWHFFNNIFSKLSEIFVAVSEDIVFFTIIG